jgi:hypothetical protein
VPKLKTCKKELISNEYRKHKNRKEIEIEKKEKDLPG